MPLDSPVAGGPVGPRPRQASPWLSVATTYVARFGNVIGLFLLFPFVASNVGATAYGGYLLLTSVATLFFLDFGMGAATVRYVALGRARGDTDEVARIVASSKLIYLVIAVVVASCYGAAITLAWSAFDFPAVHAETMLHAAIVVGAAQLLVGVPLNVFGQLVSGAGRVDLYNAGVVAQLGIRIAGTVFAIVAGYGVLGVVVADAAAILLGGLILRMISVRVLPETRTSIRRASSRHARKLWSLSSSVLVMNVAALIILQADNLILSTAVPLAAVAVYSAGYRVYQVARELTNGLTAALLPSATEAYADENAVRSQSMYVVGTRYANLVTVGVVVPVAFFIQPLMTVWVGETLATGWTVGLILLGGLLLNTNHMVAIPLLVARHRIKPFATLHAIWAGSNIVLSLFLVGRLGIEGVALGTALPLVVLEFFYVRTALRELRVSATEFVRQSLVTPYAIALACSAPLLAVALIGTHKSVLIDLVAAIAWSAAFAVCAWRFGLQPNHRAAIASTFDRFMPRPRTGESS